LRNPSTSTPSLARAAGAMWGGPIAESRGAPDYRVAGEGGATVYSVNEVFWMPVMRYGSNLPNNLRGKGSKN
jgi:hypothetical protein